MASLLHSVKWFLVILFAFVLWLDLLAVSMLIPVQRTVLDKQTWLMVIEKVDLYESFIPLASDSLDKQISLQLGRGLHPATLEPLVREAFPKPWLEGELKRIVSNYFDFISGQTETIDLSFSLQEPKRNLPQVIVNKMGSDSELVSAAGSLAQQLPNHLVFTNESAARQSLLQQRMVVSAANQALLVLLGVGLLLVVLIVALLRNPTLLAVFGIVLLLTGILVWAASQAVFSVGSAAGKELKNSLQTKAETIQFNFEPVLQPIFNSISGKMFWYSLVETLLGAVCLGSYWVLRPPKAAVAKSK